MEASMLRLIHRAGSCENGPCPNLFDVAGDGREDMVAVQGATMTDATTAAHESAVLVPRRLIIEYADLVQGAVTPGDSREDTIAISGETMTDPSALAQLSGMPAHESVVLVPRQFIIEYASQIRKEDRVDA
jgi:hypothetical protein